MNIETHRIKQYNSTYKYVLCVNGKPILITKGQNRMSKCIAYITDKSVELKDGKIKKLLDSLLKEERK